MSGAIFAEGGIVWVLGVPVWEGWALCALAVLLLPAVACFAVASNVVTDEDAAERLSTNPYSRHYRPHA